MNSSTISTCLCCLLAVLIGTSRGAIPFNDKQQMFGTSIKDGIMPASNREEITIFEYECHLPPCTITHINIPSIYPPKNASWNWTNGILRIYYLDGDEEQEEEASTATSDTPLAPALELTVLELAGESRFHQPHNDNSDEIGPWGIQLNGRTAKSGGVYSTVRIPFEKSIRMTLQAPEYYDVNGTAIVEGHSTFWMSVRGLESFPVIVGDIQLPSNARLHLARLPPTEIPRFGFVSIGDSPRGTIGILLKLQWDAIGPNLTYLEACLRFQDPPTQNMANTTTTMYLSSGMEDFFLGSSYFDMGMFRNENSGLTYFDHGRAMVGAYKTFTRDPIIFQDGFQLTWRNCEVVGGQCGDFNHCPNHFCNTNDDDEEGKQRHRKAAHAGSSIFDETNVVVEDDMKSRRVRGSGGGDDNDHSSDILEQPVIYSSLLWYYAWDNDKFQQKDEKKN